MAAAAETGRPVESRYRVSRDGAAWIPCRLRLLRIAEAEGRAVVLEISHNISGLEELKNQYDEKREWLRFLAAETDYQLWEVDVKARTFRLLYTRNLLDGRQTVYGDFPESLIENGRVHRDSAARFRAFAEELCSGKAEGSGNFILQYRQTSCYGWASMSYHMLYDEDGRPQKAIGIKEDLSYMPAQQRSVQRRVMPADLYPHLYCYLQANITTDKVEKLLLEGRERIELARFQTFTQIIHKGIDRLFSAEDGERFARKFNRDRLLEEFAQGRRWFYELSQVVDLEGTIQWISVGVNLCPDPETGDVCLFAYMSARNRQHEWEIEVQPTAEFDLSTGAYFVDSAERMARCALERCGQALCALAVIHVGGVSELLGEGDGNRQKQDILTALNVFLDTDSILWRKDDDTLYAFFPNAGSRAILKRRLESAFSFFKYPQEVRRLIYTTNAIEGFQPPAAQGDQGKVGVPHRRQSVENAVSGDDGHHEKVDGTAAGLERDPRAAVDLLCRAHARITPPEPEVKGLRAAVRGAPMNGGLAAALDIHPRRRYTAHKRQSDKSAAAHNG